MYISHKIIPAINMHPLCLTKVNEIIKDNYVSTFLNYLLSFNYITFIYFYSCMFSLNIKYVNLVPFFATMQSAICILDNNKSTAKEYTQTIKFCINSNIEFKASHNQCCSLYNLIRSRCFASLLPSFD